MEKERILIMNMKTFKNFYNNMMLKSKNVEDPIAHVLKFYETIVGIDENVGDGNIEVFDLDFYTDIMESNGLEIKYAKDVEWSELNGLE